jgi:hypothetical protein
MSKTKMIVEYLEKKVSELKTEYETYSTWIQVERNKKHKRTFIANAQDTLQEKMTTEKILETIKVIIK